MGYGAMHGIPMVATSPVRHESPVGMNPIEIQSYEPPWKALTDFALHTDLDRLNPNAPHFQHLVNQVSSFGSIAIGKNLTVIFYTQMHGYPDMPPPDMQHQPPPPGSELGPPPPGGHFGPPPPPGELPPPPPPPPGNGGDGFGPSELTYLDGGGPTSAPPGGDSGDATPPGLMPPPPPSEQQQPSV